MKSSDIYLNAVSDASSYTQSQSEYGLPFYKTLQTTNYLTQNFHQYTRIILLYPFIIDFSWQFGLIKDNNV